MRTLKFTLSKKATKSLQDNCRHLNVREDIGWYGDGFKWRKPTTCLDCGKKEGWELR